MTSRNVMPGDTTQKPGPGAHSPQNVCRIISLMFALIIYQIEGCIFMCFLTDSIFIFLKGFYRDKGHLKVCLKNAFFWVFGFAKTKMLEF